MKTLVSCTPREFLTQTNRLRHTLDKWMKDVKLREIRAIVPVLETAPIEATVEERAEIARRNRDKVREQGYQNLMAVLDAAFEKYPDETLEILALCCFVEPNEVNDHPVREYLASITELIGDDAVIDFFTSFLRLSQMGTSNA